MYTHYKSGQNPISPILFYLDAFLLALSYGNRKKRSRTRQMPFSLDKNKAPSAAALRARRKMLGKFNKKANS
jgi:hypothetical protein